VKPAKILAKKINPREPIMADDDPHRPCECGHARNYHQPTMSGVEMDMGIGRFCFFDNCECLDFVPSGEDPDADYD
jgi:hypothetical protein